MLSLEAMVRRQSKLLRPKMKPRQAEERKKVRSRRKLVYGCLMMFTDVHGA
jgi:hypothetical protein